MGQGVGRGGGARDTLCCEASVFLKVIHVFLCFFLIGLSYMPWGSHFVGEGHLESWWVVAGTSLAQR